MVDAGNLAILLVEPSEVQRRVISQHLADAGIKQLSTAASIDEAKQQILRLQPDLIASAMYFDDGTAHDLIAFLQSQPQLRETSFMLVSSEYKAHQLEALKQSGIVAILPKPFTPEQLQRAVNATIELIEPTPLALQNFDVEDLRVLVVDDSITSRHFICRVLGNLGIDDIVEAEHAQQAIAILDQQHFDIIVTDFHMPDVNGRELAASIRQMPNHAHTPILMITARTDEPQLANIKQSGIDALTDKPFEPETLRRLLARLLDQ
ncbi:response regulator [Idiomarina xiamenensis]|uniref:Chemotaxis protein CheY n=1 Tax=Idiomarina xiamenensis 10-D-4 TaxID=740709 RepID=K2L2Z7_9GAMM|nr:response regulator [Idiomarina xiamenensis]EKE84275.1 chemotaxis protein CheY [Idiomarina xiamenensis 10-D-4]